MLPSSASCVLPPVYCLWCAFVLEQDRRRRYRALGWFRAASPQVPTRDLGKARRMADEMGEGGGEFDMHPYEQIRSRIGQDRNCRWCVGVREALSWTSSPSTLGARFVECPHTSLSF